MITSFIDKHGHEINTDDEVWFTHVNGERKHGTFSHFSSAFEKIIVIVDGANGGTFAEHETVFLAKPFEHDYPEEFI